MKTKLKITEFALGACLIMLFSLSLKAQTNVDATADSDDNGPEVRTAVSKSAYNKLNTSDFSNLIPVKETSKYGISQDDGSLQTQNWQINVALTRLHSDQLNNNLGLRIGAQYFFNSFFAFEVSAQAYNGTPNAQARNLTDVQSVNVQGVSSFKSATMAQINFIPFYGKYLFSNDEIYPFHFQFSVGTGTMTDQASNSTSLVLFGIGHSIYTSAQSGFNFNLQQYTYKATSLALDTATTSNLAVSFGYFHNFSQKAAR